MINLLLVPFPALLSMLFLWIQITCLDNLPRGAYAQQRKELNRALGLLVITLVLLGSTIYTIPDLLLVIQLSDIKE